MRPRTGSRASTAVRSISSLGEARKTAAIIADPAALKDEEELERCRNATRPIRKICAGRRAGAGRHPRQARRRAEKPEYDKPQYAAAMAACEKLMELKPLKSAIRGTD